MAATKRRFCIALVLFITWQATCGSRWDQDGQEDLTSKTEELNHQSKRQLKQFANVFDEDPDESTENYWDVFLPKTLNLRNDKDKCDLKGVQDLLKASFCQPRPTVVEVPIHDPAASMVLPYYVILNQCGGGSIQGNLKCIPDKIQLAEFPILKIMPVNNGVEKTCDTVILDEHLTCTTGCSLKASDCRENQEFSKDECRCICADRNEAANCDPSKQMWVEASCSCECLPSSIHECSTGFIFNHDLCKCTRTSFRRFLSRRFLISQKHPIP